MSEEPKKKRSKKRPTQRTLEHLRGEGCLVDVVERFIKVPKHPGGGIRRDLFGIIDILCIRGFRIMGIQTTSGGNHSIHRRKCVESASTITTDPEEQLRIMAMQANLALWLATGASYELWSWSKKGGKWVARVDKFRNKEVEA